MKITLTLLPIVTLLCAGCADNDNGTVTKTPQPARYGNRESEPLEKQPRIGMSEAQLRQMYGEPNSVNHSGRGDVWTYWFNRGAAFIPYNFGYQARTGVFMFDENGRLRDFNWNE